MSAVTRNESCVLGKGAATRYIALYLSLATLLSIAYTCFRLQGDPAPSLVAPSQVSPHSKLPQPSAGGSSGDMSRQVVSSGTVLEWDLYAVNAITGRPVPSCCTTTPGFTISNLGHEGAVRISGSPGELVISAVGFRDASIPLSATCLRIGTVCLLPTRPQDVYVAVVDSRGAPVGNAEIWVRSDSRYERRLGATDGLGKWQGAICAPCDLMARLQDSLISAWLAIVETDSAITLVAQPGAQVRLMDVDNHALLCIAESGVVSQGGDFYAFQGGVAVCPTGRYRVHVPSDSEWVFAQASESCERALDCDLQPGINTIAAKRDAGVVLDVRDQVTGLPVTSVFVSPYVRRAMDEIVFPPAGLRCADDGQYSVYSASNVRTLGLPLRISVQSEGYRGGVIYSPRVGVNVVNLEPEVVAKHAVVIHGREHWPIEHLAIYNGSDLVRKLEWCGTMEPVCLPGDCSGVVCNGYHIPMDSRSGCSELRLAEMTGAVVVDVRAGENVRLQLKTSIGFTLNPVRCEGVLVFPYVPPGIAKITMANTECVPSDYPEWEKIGVSVGSVVALSGANIKAFAPSAVSLDVTSCHATSLYVVPYVGRTANTTSMPYYSVRVGSEGVFQVPELPCRPSGYCVYKLAEGSSNWIPLLDLNVNCGRHRLGLGDIRVVVGGGQPLERIVVGAVLPGVADWSGGITASRRGAGELVLKDVPEGVSEVIRISGTRITGRWPVSVVPGSVVTLPIDIK